MSDGTLSTPTFSKGLFVAPVGGVLGSVMVCECEVGVCVRFGWAFCTTITLGFAPVAVATRPLVVKTEKDGS